MYANHVWYQAQVQVQDVVVERLNRPQSESWLTQALNRKRERSQTQRLDEHVGAYKDVAPAFSEQNQQATGFESFEEWVSLKVRPRSSQAPEYSESSDEQPHEQQEPEPPSADLEKTHTQASEEATTPTAHATSSFDSFWDSSLREARRDEKEQLGRLDSTIANLQTNILERLGQLDASVTQLKQREGSENVSSHLQALRIQLEQIQQLAQKDRQQLSSAIQALQQELREARQALSSREKEFSAELSCVIAAFQKESQRNREEFSSSLAALRQDLSAAVTGLQQRAQEDHEQYTSAVTACQAAVQEMQRASVTSLQELSSQAHAHTEELHALQNARGSKSHFWNRIFMLVALVGAVSTLSCTMFKS